jgi:hypothetical protein
MSRLSDPAPLVKPWWQSKTIIGIVSLLCVFFLDRFDAGITQDEIGNLLTMLFALVSAVIAIIGRVTAKKELRVTVPGGKFNPNAEVRKPKAYRFPKTGGYYELPSVWAGIAWLIALGLLFALMASMQASQELEWEEMMDRRDAMLETQVLPPITYSEFFDRRPFLVRLLKSLSVVPRVKVTHESESSEVKISYQITGGAEW